MIYVASRASVPKYPTEWRRLRSQGWPINSSWIDEAGEGETACMSELWKRIEAEVRAARGVVLWAEEEDFPLKGAFIEVGMALGMGKPVAVYTKTAFDNRNYRPFGSWMNHPLVQRCFSLNSAMTWVLSQPLPHGGGGGSLMATKDITDWQVCEAFAAYQAHGLPFADERLRQSTSQPDKVLLSAMERACRRNLVEYGVSLRSGWLTDRGKALLADGVGGTDAA